jgi:hypothetical protein
VAKPLDSIGIHLFLCGYGEKRMTFDDVVWNAFVFIEKDVTFCVLHE